MVLYPHLYSTVNQNQIHLHLHAPPLPAPSTVPDHQQLHQQLHVNNNNNNNTININNNNNNDDDNDNDKDRYAVDDVTALVGVAGQAAVANAGNAPRGVVEIGLLPPPASAPLDGHHQVGDIRYGGDRQQQQHTDLAVWRPY